MATAPALLAACADLDKHPPPLSDDQARAFFEEFPLQQLLGVFSTLELEPKEAQLIVDTLSRLLATPAGRTLLARAGPILEAATHAVLPSLRRLAAEQLGLALLPLAAPLPDASTGEAASLQAQSAAGLLVALLQDEDTGVAATAARGLERGAAASAWLTPALLDGGTPVGRRVADLAAAPSRTVHRLRAMALLVAIGGRDAGAAELLRASGALQPLLSELGNTGDPLACLAALQLVQELAGQVGQAPLLCELALPQLLLLLHDPTLQSGAFAVAAELVGATAAATDSASASSSDGPAPDAALPLLRAMREVLDEAGDGSAEAEAAVLDAVGRLGVSRGGARLVLGNEELLTGILGRALGRPPSLEVRLTALHAVASLAGVERAGEAQRRDAAILSSEAESRLRAAVFSAACGGGVATLGEVLWALLAQPFQDVSTAVLRFMAALALRPWFAAELCRHPALMSRLLGASAETAAAARHWRFAAVSAAAAAARAAASGDTVGGTDGVDDAARAELTAALPRLQRAVAAGPYGNGSGAHVAGAANGGGVTRGVPQVATLGQ